MPGINLEVTRDEYLAARQQAVTRFTSGDELLRVAWREAKDLARISILIQMTKDMGSGPIDLVAKANARAKRDAKEALATFSVGEDLPEIVVSMARLMEAAAQEIVTEEALGLPPAALVATKDRPTFKVVLDELVELGIDGGMMMDSLSEWIISQKPDEYNVPAAVALLAKAEHSTPQAIMSKVMAEVGRDYDAELSEIVGHPVTEDEKAALDAGFCICGKCDDAPLYAEFKALSTDES